MHCGYIEGVTIAHLTYVSLLPAMRLPTHTAWLRHHGTTLSKDTAANLCLSSSTTRHGLRGCKDVNQSACLDCHTALTSLSAAMHSRQAASVVLCAVIGTLKNPQEGLKMLNLSYTGEQRAQSDDDEDKPQQESRGHSDIRDPTGSGVERKVDGTTDMSDQMFKVGLGTGHSRCSMM